MGGKLKTVSGQAVYTWCKAIVEPVFGQIEEARGFRRFWFRGPGEGDSRVEADRVDAQRARAVPRAAVFAGRKVSKQARQRSAGPRAVKTPQNVDLAPDKASSWVDLLPTGSSPPCKPLSAPLLREAPRCSWQWAYYCPFAQRCRPGRAVRSGNRAPHQGMGDCKQNFVDRYRAVAIAIDDGTLGHSHFA